MYILSQVLVEELQLKVQSSEEGHKKFGEEYKVLNDKVSDLESSHQKSQLELQTQLEELKMKVCFCCVQCTCKGM